VRPVSAKTGGGCGPWRVTITRVSGDGEVVVKELGPDDWRLTRRLRMEALRESPEAFGGSYEEAANRTEEQWRAWPTAGVVFAAWADGEPVGLAGGWLPNTQPGVTKLISMWVAPAVRGRRLADRLMAAVVGWARRHGSTSVELDVFVENKEAHRAYARYGFVAENRPDVTSGAIAMRLRLDQHSVGRRATRTADDR
jgi:GNAT superfamily N-acetyltransferase